MFGYATRETKALMPMPIQIAHTLAQRLAEVRKAGVDPLPAPRRQDPGDGPLRERPAGRDREAPDLDPARPDLDGETLIKPDLWEHVVEPVLHEEYKELFTEQELLENFLVNPTGKFEIGGPDRRRRA